MGLPPRHLQVFKVLTNLIIIQQLNNQVYGKSCNLKDIFLTPNEYEKQIKHLDNCEILERCNFQTNQVEKHNHRRDDLPKAIANAQILLQVPNECPKENCYYHQVNPHVPYPHYHPKLLVPYQYAHVHTYPLILPEDPQHNLIHHHHPSHHEQFVTIHEPKCDHLTVLDHPKSNDIHKTCDRSKTEKCTNDDLIKINLIITPDGDLQVAPPPRKHGNKNDVINLSSRNNINKEASDDGEKEKKTSKYFIPLPWKPFMEKALSFNENNLKFNVNGTNIKTGKLQVIKINIPKNKCEYNNAVVEIESVKDIDIDEEKCDDDTNKQNLKKECDKDNVSQNSGVDLEASFSRFPATPTKPLVNETCSTHGNVTEKEEEFCYDIHTCPTSPKPTYNDISLADYTKEHPKDLQYNIVHPQYKNDEQNKKTEVPVNENYHEPLMINLPYIYSKPHRNFYLKSHNYGNYNPNNDPYKNLNDNSNNNPNNNPNNYPNDNQNNYSNNNQNNYSNNNQNNYPNNNPNNYFNNNPNNYPNNSPNNYPNNNPNYPNNNPNNYPNNDPNNYPNNSPNNYLNNNPNNYPNTKPNNYPNNSPNNYLNNNLNYGKPNNYPNNDQDHNLNNNQPKFNVVSSYSAEVEDFMKPKLEALPIFNPAHNSRSPYAGMKNKRFYRKNFQNDKVSTINEDDKIYFEDELIPCTKRPDCRCPECVQYTRELNE